MRVTTLKASPASLGGLLAYYGGLADDQAGRDGAARGPVDYYLDPAEPPVGGGDRAVRAWAWKARFGLSSWRPFSPPAVRAPALAWDGDSGPSRPGPSTRPSRPPKSVSVLWALSPDPFVHAEVLAAHDTAVQAALDWFEVHGAVTRRGTTASTRSTPVAWPWRSSASTPAAAPIPNCTPTPSWLPKSRIPPASGFRWTPAS